MAITLTGDGPLVPNIAGAQSWPIIFHVTGLTGQAITFSAPGMSPATALTDGSGNATFRFRPGGTVTSFPIDLHTYTATAGTFSVVFHASYADVPPVAALITPPVASNLLVTAPTTYTVRVYGNVGAPFVAVLIETYAAGVWSTLVGPILTDGSGYATLVAPFSGVGFFRVNCGGYLIYGPNPYDTTGGGGPGPFPLTPPPIVPPAPAYGTGAAKGATTASAIPVATSNVMKIPPGMLATDHQFIPTLNDRLGQLAQAVSAGSGGLAVGTHAARLAFPATKAGIGAQFFESDPARQALYYVARPLGGAFQWRLALASGSGPLSSRPNDLAALDVGFRYLATDSKSTQVWSGSVWVPLAETGPFVTCTHAERILADPQPYSAANYADGTPLFETDRTFLYRALASRWIYVSGTMRLSAAQLNAVLVSTLDPLTTRDTGALFYTTDYGHISRYNESGAMEWGPGAIADRPGSYVFAHEDPATDPQTPANAWHACDGSTVEVQQSDGTTRSFSTPANAAAIAPGSTALLFVRR